MPRFSSIDRESKLYNMHIFGRQLHVELHPNTTSGGFFRIQTVKEGEAILERLRVGIEALKADLNQNANLPIPAEPEGEDS